ncbi:MAG: amidohydrolase family protein [Gammaproteobacteria bacterium]|nr:amidohydrolase family protein [Gammaproteobacteria bacterium]
MGHTLFDAHLHIIDPAFPLIENQGFVPAAFTVDDYLAQAKPLGITGGAVVSGSFQGFDQTYLVEALRRLGAGFVGVAQVPLEVDDETLARLNRAGVRGVRFNLYRGKRDTLSNLQDFALRVYERYGWHAEFYLDAANLDDLTGLLTGLPKVSIDHLGLSGKGLPDLLRLAEHGVRVKATGFGRVNFDVAAALKQLWQCNPEALMFGTDLPSTRAPRAFQAADITLISEALGDEAAARVLRDNALAFYGVG